ncbi:hypothetical protein Taro_000178 [Colocasia esculenta]|uniref:Uncharacterized protein n=1 Tax=Colocasia esculenta TaxID=4460 RepID=A0A843TCB6_COLES|nr:hypothetical protein [Colocasia esculenta]
MWLLRCPVSFSVSAGACRGVASALCFDCAGYTGVVFGQTLVVGRGITLFRCFFLLLWLVRDWLSILSLVRDAHPPTLFSTTFGVPGEGSGRSGRYSGIRALGTNEIGNEWLAFQQGLGVSCRRVLLLLLGARAASVVDIFTRAMIGFILGLRIRSASLLELSKCLVCRVATLVERCDTCLWLLSALCWLVVNSNGVLPKFFFDGYGGSEVSSELCCALAIPLELRCITWLLVF